MASRVLAVEWLIPVSQQPIRHAAVVVAGSNVDWVGRERDLPRAYRKLPTERRRGVMTPGLVNAHTHLQYTNLADVGTHRYHSFEEWAFGFEDAYLAVGDDGDAWRLAAQEGARQVRASGTTVVAEIVTNPEAGGALSSAGLTGIEYLEVIGAFERSWTDHGRAAFIGWLDQPHQLRRGISPHAMYSVDAAVIADLVRLAAERGMRVHTHLAESAVEVDVYHHGDRSVLEIYGDLRDEFELIRNGGTGLRTAEYADSIGLLNPTTHVAHAIYLDRAERDLLLRRGTQVALCPRSNAVIGLAQPPVAAYLTEGHEIAVGTDSLASSPSLDLLEDVAALADSARQQGYTYDDLDRRLVRAATLGGAMALGLDTEGYGTVRAGGPADLALFDVVVGPDETPEAALVRRGAGSCALTIAAGGIGHDLARRPGSTGDPVPAPPVG